jgi:hypothetical protein
MLVSGRQKYFPSKDAHVGSEPDSAAVPVYVTRAASADERIGMGKIII